ncbi:class I SAM-dependent methyltransferase [Methylobacterium oxalidis]|uniref:hypothetical protein n=1 Tax=Methylobacterium oxalidis TaxID=944322 RepID=UPI0033163522
MDKDCPICAAGTANPFVIKAGFQYFECSACESLFIDTAVLRDVDLGRSLVDYTAAYWNSELAASRARSYGPALARTAETFLYARRPINVFLDIGAGAGYLLDALSTYLPSSKAKFWGIEKYPPIDRVANSNLVIGTIADFHMRVDGGVCVEVIEHLTPTMLRSLLSELADVSNEDALYVFNSGQPCFVKQEDPEYLDPTGRGHLVSYSLKGIESLANPLGFQVRPLPGKTWAFVLEKTGTLDISIITDRIWTALPSNRETLNDPRMGSVMYVLGIESARAYS